MSGIEWTREDLDEWFADDFEAANEAVHNWDDGESVPERHYLQDPNHNFLP
jgi:hypothetical protein